MGAVSTIVYTSQTISGYNASPPADDGSQVNSNKLEWAKHKTKLGDPIKTLSEAINTQLVSAFGKVPNSDAGERFQFSGSWAFEVATATIGTDSVDVNASSLLIGTESGATSDTLQVLNTSTDNYDGAIAWIRQRNSTEEIVVVHATSTLATATGANIFLATGDSVTLSHEQASMLFQRDDNAASGWVELNRNPIDTGTNVLQISSTFDGSVVSGTTAFPQDDTIPTATEGALMLEHSFAAEKIGTRVKIEWNGFLDTGANGNFALFTDINATATSDALKVGGFLVVTNQGSTSSLQYIATTTTTATQTFSIRAGTTGGGTIIMNGYTATGSFGGAFNSSIITTEYE